MAGRKFLARPYYSQRAVFVSPVSAFFHSSFDPMTTRGAYRYPINSDKQSQRGIILAARHMGWDSSQF